LGEACGTGFSSEKYSQRQISQGYLKQAKLNLVTTKIQSTTARYPKSTKPPERQLDANGPIGPGRAAALPNASVDTPSSPLLRELRPPGRQTQLLGIPFKSPSQNFFRPCAGIDLSNYERREGNSRIRERRALTWRSSSCRLAAPFWPPCLLRWLGSEFAWRRGRYRTGKEAEQYSFFSSCKWLGPHSVSDSQPMKQPPRATIFLKKIAALEKKISKRWTSFVIVSSYPFKILFLLLYSTQ
jgi:hypothetical protein